ncbi:energy-coupling factor transporter transmembrane component T family protein [Arthrobacter sp. C152]
MNQQSFGQRTGPDTESGHRGAGAATGSSRPAAPAGKGGPSRFSKDANQAVLGPFTLRDLTVFAATLILFVASLLPIFGARYNLWNLSNLFFLGLGIVLPLIVSALFAARRLAPSTKIRIGSLSIDQFASVVASFAVAFFFLTVAVAYVHVLLVALIGAVILFAATVLGRFLPYLSGDFQGRTEVPAHLVARDAAVPVHAPRAPRAPKPEAASHQPRSGGKGIFGGAGAGSSAVQPGAGTREPVRSSQPPATAAVPTTPAAGATLAGATGAAAPAGATPAAPVSTAPEAADRTPDVDAGPPTQAADVVRPAQAPAASTPATPSGAPAPEAAASEGSLAPRATWEPPAATAVHQQVRSEEPIGATVDPASRHDETDDHPIHEAFWFAVAQHRTAYDPRTGAPAFVIEPGGWVLALEDRGHEFLVQHTDGRLGILRDLSNIERG